MGGYQRALHLACATWCPAAGPRCLGPRGGRRGRGLPRPRRTLRWGPVLRPPSGIHAALPFPEDSLVVPYQ